MFSIPNLDSFIPSSIWPRTEGNCKVPVMLRTVEELER